MALLDLHDGDVRVFHYRDGLCFFRQKDGAVRIEDMGTLVGVIDPHSWASVVASMSAGGEDWKSYETARDFHNPPKWGDRPVVDPTTTGKRIEPIPEPPPGID